MLEHKKVSLRRQALGLLFTSRPRPEYVSYLLGSVEHQLPSRLRRDLKGAKVVRDVL